MRRLHGGLREKGGKGFNGGGRRRERGGSMAVKGGEKDEEAPWRLRESGDSMEPEDREWLKWKRINIEPRLERLRK
jgi:hypothetical protein